MNIILRREPVQHDARCTIGMLSLGTLVLHTIERPWVPSPASRGGTKGVSCVPVGRYQLEKHNTEAHPMTWALVNPQLDVVHFPGNSRDLHVRTAVLIHSANFVYELRGCIAPGMAVAHGAPGSHGSYSVLESRKAMRAIREFMPWTDEHTLEIQ